MFGEDGLEPEPERLGDKALMSKKNDVVDYVPTLGVE